MFTKEDIEKIMASMPYSDCGQPMYNEKRKQEHIQLCNYCKNYIARNSPKSVERRVNV